MPQIVLQVPPEVIQLLTAIKSSLQRLEGEVRDCRLRLGYPVLSVAPAAPARPAPGPKPVEAAPHRRPMPSGAPMSLHTPAGPKAAARVTSLLAHLDLKCGALAEKLGVTDQALRNILSQKSGISVRMDAALSKLEPRP